MLWRRIRNNKKLSVFGSSVNRFFIGLVYCDRPLAQMLSAQTIGAGGLGFGSWTGRTGTVSPTLRYFFGGALPRRQVAEMGSATHYTVG